MSAFGKPVTAAQDWGLTVALPADMTDAMIGAGAETYCRFANSWNDESPADAAVRIWQAMEAARQYQPPNEVDAETLAKT